jgi:hypothetical protein
MGQETDNDVSPILRRAQHERVTGNSTLPSSRGGRQKEMNDRVSETADGPNHEEGEKMESQESNASKLSYIEISATTARAPPTSLLRQGSVP